MSAHAGDLLFQPSPSSLPQAPLSCWWEVPWGRALPCYQTELHGFNNYPTELAVTTQTELNGSNRLPELTLQTISSHFHIQQGFLLQFKATRMEQSREAKAVLLRHRNTSGAQAASLLLNSEHVSNSYCPDGYYSSAALLLAPLSPEEGFLLLFPAAPGLVALQKSVQLISQGYQLIMHLLLSLRKTLMFDQNAKIRKRIEIALVHVALLPFTQHIISGIPIKVHTFHPRYIIFIRSASTTKLQPKAKMTLILHVGSTKAHSFLL